MVVPENYLSPEEENEKILRRNPEFEFEDKHKELEGWVYRYPRVLINGDFNYRAVKDEEVLQSITEKHPETPLLSLISEGDSPLWKKTVVGSKDTFQEEGSERQISNQISMF